MRKSLATSALLASAITLIVASNTASAQTDSFINLGTFDGAQVFVASGSNAARVGNGVLTFVHQVFPQYTFSSQYLAGCDGSWMTESIRNAVSHTKVPVEAEREARAQASDVVLDNVDFSDWQKLDLDFGAALKSNLKALCKSAAIEPKNVLIPIAGFPMSGEKPGGTVSIMTGTVVSKGGVIEGWTRTSYFKREPLLVNGTPVEVKGVVRTVKRATGLASQARTAFNCINRSAAHYQYVDYTADGRVSDQATFPLDMVKFDSVVPNSIGESQLDAFCRVYGKK